MTTIQTTTPAKIIPVAVGVIIHPNTQKILLAQRPYGKLYAGFWEFAGGKIEEGETQEQALYRELLEELNINIDLTQAYFFKNYEFIYPHAHVQLHVMKVFAFSGEIKGLERQAWQWYDLNQLPTPCLPASQLIIKDLMKI